MPDASSGPIVVASCVDAGYLPFVEVLAASIAASADPGRPVDYHVLYVLKGDYEVIDSRWNVQPLDTNFVSDPWITHYAGRKPWQQLGIPGGSRWWKHARSLPTFPLFVWRFIRERSRLELKSLRRRIARRLHPRR